MRMAMDTRNQLDLLAFEATAKTARKPYAAPVLRELGDVRELTRGGGATVNEGFASKKPAG